MRLVFRISALLLLSLILAPVGLADPTAAPNSLTGAEKSDGWILLFDGKSTKGWRRLGFDTFPDKKWVVRDGMLVHLPVKDGENDDIVFERPFDNFELSWEWQVPKAQGNSGIKYRIVETKGKNNAYGPEYQMMNDPGVNDKHATSSLYDLIPPKNNKLAPEGQFNVSRIVVQNDHVEHWLNGVKTVEFTFWDDAFKKAYAASKFKKSDAWGKQPSGFIALTDHVDEAWFRSIKIRSLPGKAE